MPVGGLQEFPFAAVLHVEVVGGQFGEVAGGEHGLAAPGFGDTGRAAGAPTTGVSEALCKPSSGKTSGITAM